MFAGNMTIEALNLASTVRTISWGAQNDVLGHASVKAFVTQTGINSLYETAYHGKPVVCIPLVADQLDNAAKVKGVPACCAV